MSNLKAGDIVENVNSPSKEYVVNFDEEKKVWHVGKIGKHLHFDTPDELLEYYRQVTDSPTVRLIQIFAWKNRETSENRAHGLFHQLITIAIESRMRFDNGDLEKIIELSYRNWWHPDEWFYKTAIEAKNLSAAKVYEIYKNRAPFIFADNRLHVDSQFIWEGLQVNVTSFSEDGEKIIACQQEKDRSERNPYGTTKTRRVFKLTRDDLKKKSELNEKLTVAFNAVKEKLAVFGDERNWSFPYRNGISEEKLFCRECSEKEWGSVYRDGVKYVYDLNQVIASCNCGKWFLTKPTRELLEQEFIHFDFTPDKPDSLRAMMEFFKLADVQAEKLIMLCSNLVNAQKNNNDEK